MILFAPIALLACSNDTGAPADNAAFAANESQIAPVDRPPFTVQPMAEFDEPWAMAFLPDGRLLVTEKAGALKLYSPSSGTVTDVAGTPDVVHRGQGGFGDIVPGHAFGEDSLLYLSWVEAGDGGSSGAVVGRAKLVENDGRARLDGMQIIWRQQPKVSGSGHFAHRIAFSPDGQYLFISSGERQKFTPAQDMATNLGKIVRLRPDGSVPDDNPFAQKGGITAQIWSLGHRNILGMAFDADGRLWAHEMGPRGGDELNLIKKGENYGYPIVSDGDHYDGRPIPDHDTRPEFEAPKLSWTPVISPAGAIIYSGDLFPRWKGSVLLGALSGQALVRVALNGENARKADRWDMDQRIREVEQGPDGALWLLEDGPSARLLKLTPR
jgi:glucose/arabinose dehydrogenase